MKGAFTFFKLNFLIIGLCNYSADSLLEIISFLTLPWEAILSKNI